jgi:hypothetical protein
MEIVAERFLTDEMQTRQNLPGSGNFCRVDGKILLCRKEKGGDVDRRPSVKFPEKLTGTTT